MKKLNSKETYGGLYQNYRKQARIRVCIIMWIHAITVTHELWLYLGMHLYLSLLSTTCSKLPAKYLNTRGVPTYIIKGQMLPTVVSFRACAV